jgi:hypothetical protein
VEIVSIISRTGEQAAAVAEKYGAKHSARPNLRMPWPATMSMR